MRNVLYAMIIWIMLPSLAAACAYPNGLRATNATLLSILDAGGTVSVHHRQALRRSLDQINAAMVLQALSQEVPRRDVRAAGTVLQTAQALADGRGVRVDADMRDTLRRLSDAVDVSCSGGTEVATGAEDAQGAEQGTERSAGQGGRPMTYREQVARLSLTFTVYLVFLAALLGFRQQWRARARARLVAPVPERAQSEPGKRA